MPRHTSFKTFSSGLATAASTMAFVFAGLASADAAVLVMGNTKGHDCYLAAKTRIDARAGLKLCNEALEDGGMTLKDVAATHVNRGVLRDAFGQYEDAFDDFNRSVSYNPELGDAYLNRGAALIRLKRFDDAMADVQKGMVLGVTEPEIAYYDLGVVQEDLGHITEAYYSYKHAVELAPGFTLATEALKHFVVTRKPAQPGPRNDGT